MTEWIVKNTTTVTKTSLEYAGPGADIFSSWWFNAALVIFMLLFILFTLPYLPRMSPQ